MKNKNKIFLYLNILLLTFLCLVGFSPQYQKSAGNVVYAESIAGNNKLTRDVDKPDDKPDVNIKPGDISSNKDISANATSSINDIKDILDGISDGLSVVAIAFSILTIVIIGIKIINSGTGNVMDFVKSKKDITNAIICIMFILVVPTVTKGILEFTLPNSVTSGLGSTSGSGETIGDFSLKPTSNFAEYIKTATIVGEENKKSIHDAASENYKSVFTENTVMGFISGLFKSALNIIIGFIGNLIYAPICAFASLVGSIGFYPVSLDATMYGEGVVTALKGSFDTAHGNMGIDVGKTFIDNVATVLSTATNVMTSIHYVFQQVALLSLQTVCYYFGVTTLLGTQQSDVKQFLMKLLKGVTGILLFPFVLEFLLDLDGFLSMAIFKMSGDGLPGFGILTVLPSNTENYDGFFMMVLSITMAIMVLNLAKSFFVRRVEICFYYMVSPIYFIKDMVSSKGGSVKDMMDKVVGATFMTTVYAPFFVIISIMINEGKSTPNAGMMYYIFIIGILWKGTEVTRRIVATFVGGSAAAGDAALRMRAAQQGTMNKVMSSGKSLAKGAAAVGAGAAAYGGARAYKTHQDKKAGTYTPKDKLGFKGNVKRGAGWVKDYAKLSADKFAYDNLSKGDKKFSLNQMRLDANSSKSNYQNQQHGYESNNQNFEHNMALKQSEHEKNMIETSYKNPYSLHGTEYGKKYSDYIRQEKNSRGSDNPMTLQEVNNLENAFSNAPKTVQNALDVRDKNTKKINEYRQILSNKENTLSNKEKQTLNSKIMSLTESNDRITTYADQCKIAMNSDFDVATNRGTMQTLYDGYSNLENEINFVKTTQKETEQFDRIHTSKTVASNERATVYKISDAVNKNTFDAPNVRAINVGTSEKYQDKSELISNLSVELKNNNFAGTNVSESSINRVLTNMNSSLDVLGGVDVSSLTPEVKTQFITQSLDGLTDINERVAIKSILESKVNGSDLVRQQFGNSSTIKEAVDKLNLTDDSNVSVAINKALEDALSSARKVSPESATSTFANGLIESISNSASYGLTDTNDIKTFNNAISSFIETNQSQAREHIRVVQDGVQSKISELINSNPDNSNTEIAEQIKALESYKTNIETVMNGDKIKINDIVSIQNNAHYTTASTQFTKDLCSNVDESSALFAKLNNLSGNSQNVTFNDLSTVLNSNSKLLEVAIKNADKKLYTTCSQINSIELNQTSILEDECKRDYNEFITKETN